MGSDNPITTERTATTTPSERVDPNLRSVREQLVGTGVPPGGDGSKEVDGRGRGRVPGTSSDQIESATQPHNRREVPVRTTVDQQAGGPQHRTDLPGKALDHQHRLDLGSDGRGSALDPDKGDEGTKVLLAHDRQPDDLRTSITRGAEQVTDSAIQALRGYAAALEQRASNAAGIVRQSLTNIQSMATEPRLWAAVARGAAHMAVDMTKGELYNEHGFPLPGREIALALRSAGVPMVGAVPARLLEGVPGLGHLAHDSEGRMSGQHNQLRAQAATEGGYGKTELSTDANPLRVAAGTARAVVNEINVAANPVAQLSTLGHNIASGVAHNDPDRVGESVVPLVVVAGAIVYGGTRGGAGGSRGGVEPAMEALDNATTQRIQPPTATDPLDTATTQRLPAADPLDAASTQRLPAAAGSGVEPTALRPPAAAEPTPPRPQGQHQSPAQVPDVPALPAQDVPRPPDPVALARAIERAAEGDPDLARRIAAVVEAYRRTGLEMQFRPNEPIGVPTELVEGVRNAPRAVGASAPEVGPQLDRLELLAQRRLSDVSADLRSPGDTVRAAVTALRDAGQLPAGASTFREAGVQGHNVAWAAGGGRGVAPPVFTTSDGVVHVQLPAGRWR